MLDGDDVHIARGGDEDVALWCRLLHGHHLVAFHRRLQRADGIDLRDHDAGALAAQRFRRALAHIAVAGHDGHLAGHHGVGGALDAVHQAFAAAVEIVELRLGDGVVDVDGRKQQRALLGHLIETVDARGGFLGHALDGIADLLVPAGMALQPRLDGGVENLFFLVRRLGDQRRVLGGAAAEMEQQRGVAAIIQDHVRRAAVVPFEDAVGELPVFLQRLALVGEDRRAGLGDRGGGVVLRREDVAGRPAHVGAQGLQRLDQHRGLDGHMQAAGNAGALQRLLLAVLRPQRHQAGHLGLGDGDLLAAPIGEGDIGDPVVGGADLVVGRFRRRDGFGGSGLGGGRGFGGH